MCLVKKILKPIFPAMSRRPRRFPAGTLLGRVAVLAMLAAPLLLAKPAPAGVIEIGPQTYRLDGGKPVTGMWEIAERLAYAKDTAIVVVDPKASANQVQPLLQLLETLKVPTVLTKKADYKILLDRGVLRPTTTP
jgi:hypothetical protein